MYTSLYVELRAIIKNVNLGVSTIGEVFVARITSNKKS